MRILVVDDSETIRNAVGDALAKAGYSPDFAVNGIEALRLALRQAYGLIMTDIEMPVMDGLKFIHRIRMSGPNQKAPVLVFSSCRNEDTVLTAGSFGVQGYILKPVDPSSLIQKVSEVLGGEPTPSAC